MKIKPTNFQASYHRTTTIKPSFGEDYDIHSVDVYNEIVIDGVAHSAIYQTGLSYIANDNSRPDPELELSGQAGGSDLLSAIDALTESEIEQDNLCELDEDLESMSDEDIRKIWAVLRDNTIQAEHEFEYMIDTLTHNDALEYDEEEL